MTQFSGPSLRVARTPLAANLNLSSARSTLSSASFTRSLVIVTLSLVLLTLSLAIATAPAAAAKFKVTATVQADGAGQRIVVAVSSTSRVSSKKRPRSVKVKAAGALVKLSKFTPATAAAGYGSNWRSKVFTGDYATKLAALGGKRVSVSLKSRNGTSTQKPKVTVQTGGGGTATPPGPLFPPPPAALSGNDAFNYFSKWFLNSAFSDCAGVWPACAVEQRYVHCPTGAWEYHRNTPTSGSDIHAYDTFTINGATVNADGSWAVSYVTGTGGNYYWLVSTTGIATGQYTFGATVEALGPSYWSQPAITWQKPTGAC